MQESSLFRSDSESNRDQDQQNVALTTESASTSAAQNEVKSNESDKHTENQSTTIKDADYYMLFEDVPKVNRLPPSLKQLLNSLHQKQLHAPAERLTAVIYYLFLESGFVPSTLPAELRSKIPSHWGYSFSAQIPDYSFNIVADEISEKYLQSKRSQNASSTEWVYEFNLNLLEYCDDELQLVIRKIFGGAALCVTFCASGQEQAASIILVLNDYINETSNFEEILSNPMEHIKNVRELVENVKQHLIAPVRNVIMYDSAYPNAALHGMPQEILWNLFAYLRSDLQTLQKVSQACVYLRNMAISYLHEKNIRLKNRRPTPIIYDPLDQVHHRSRYRVFNDWMNVSGLIYGGYRPLNYYFRR